jgi:YHS domain-containing protein
MTKTRLTPSAFVVVILLGVYGCNSPSPEMAAPADPIETAHDVHDSSDHEHSTLVQDAQATDMEKMTQSLANFSAEDRESAMKQHVCPVSGEMLGTMGAPQKIDVNGKDVWICCDGCKDKLLADPEKYLAKLAK